jgi:hypothetical protein
MESVPRQLRVHCPEAIRRFMRRGDSRKDIYGEAVDRRDFLKTPAKACQKTGFQVHERKDSAAAPWQWAARLTSLKNATACRPAPQIHSSKHGRENYEHKKFDWNHRSPGAFHHGGPRGHLQQ